MKNIQFHLPTKKKNAKDKKDILKAALTHIYTLRMMKIMLCNVKGANHRDKPRIITKLYGAF